MGLISRVSSRTYRRKKKTNNVRRQTLRPRRLYRLQPRIKNPIHEPSYRQTKVSTMPRVANGTSENELLLSTNPPRTPRSSTAKKAEAESSGAELCDHTAKAVTSKSSSTATCHPLNSPAESESCFTKWIID